MKILLRTAFCVLRRFRPPSLRHSAVATAGTLALLIGSVACTDVGTSPSVPVALAFDTLPSPSVVFGDTLRDINGVATPLTGHAYNADGKEIIGAPIMYFEPGVKPADQSVVIDSATGYLIAKAEPPKTSVTLRAEVGPIPSGTGRTLEIVYLPEAVDRGASVTRTEDTLTYLESSSNAASAASLSLRVLGRPSPDSALRGIRSWLVKYSVVSPAGMDTLLVNESSNVSTIDTTGADGIASRRIRIRTKEGGNLSTGVPDTVIVEATARNKHGPLPGAPVRYLIILRKTGS